MGKSNKSRGRNDRLADAVRAHLGLPAVGTRHRTVMQAVADRMQVEKFTKQEGYALIARYAAEHGIVARGARGAIVGWQDPFLATYEWRALRMRVLVARGARCECCGATPKDGVVMNVDHIKPRKQFPELALEFSNLQVLCSVCNHGKGNWDQTDWRADAGAAPTPTPVVIDPMRPRLVKKAAG